MNKPLSIDEINLLHSQNEALKKQNADLQKDYQELKDKMQHIKMIGYGNAYEIEKAIESICNDYEIGEGIADEMTSCLWEEVEKTGNLCLMCDGVNKYVAYEAALNKVLEKANLISQFTLPESVVNKDIKTIIDIIEHVLNLPTAKQAVEKAKAEYKKYEEKE